MRADQSLSRDDLGIVWSYTAPLAGELFTDGQYEGTITGLTGLSTAGAL